MYNNRSSCEYGKFETIINNIYYRGKSIIAANKVFTKPPYIRSVTQSRRNVFRKIEIINLIRVFFIFRITRYHIELIYPV